MDMVICKVVDDVVLKAMRYDADSVNGDLDELFGALVSDTTHKSGWHIVHLNTYRHNVEVGNWEEADDDNTILSIGQDIWEDY